MKILIIGGNHFFGKKLAENLVVDGDEVTLLNRGNSDDGLGGKVKRIKCDRNNKDELSKVVTEKYDIIYDQCCFDYDQAKIACEVFADKASRYIFTSSVSVYDDYGSNLDELIFDPYNYEFSTKCTMNDSYSEAKRQAEASFFENATFPVVAVRFPIVLDAQDATKRLNFHVLNIMNEKEIFFKNLDAKISFISKDDAASSLKFLGRSDFEGPVNIASSKPVSLQRFVEIIEENVGKKINRAEAETLENKSSYNIEESWYVDTTKMKTLGIELSEIEDYLPKMVRSIKNANS